jgi:hypothetical protein
VLSGSGSAGILNFFWDPDDPDLKNRFFYGDEVFRAGFDTFGKSDLDPDTTGPKSIGTT